ncbi:tetratricopeptide repeat protein [Halalkalibacter lacteus]|uniref:tetratricopeptide repeat protein n=1 Tax=Halalkalibacter lacteus TaxID=3090663 RepID=UPI002FC7744C
MNATELLNTGKKNLLEDDYIAAKKYFQSAIKLDPNNGEAHAFLAASYGKLMENGGFMDRIKYFPQLEKEIAIALKLSPDSTVARRVNGLRLIKTPKEFGGNPSKAIGEFLYCIERGVQDADLYYGLGLAYIQTKEFTKAKDALDHGQTLSPNHLLIQQQLGLVNRSVSNGNS